MYKRQVELFAAQKELFVALTRRMDIIRKPGWDDRVQIHLTLPSQELGILAQGVFPEYPHDMSSFNPALCLSLVIVRVRDGKWLKLCRNIPPEHSAEPSNIFFYTDVYNESDDSESDDGPFRSVSLHFPHEYYADRYAATGASLMFDVNRNPDDPSEDALRLLPYWRCVCGIVYFWDEQGAWV